MEGSGAVIAVHPQSDKPDVEKIALMVAPGTLNTIILRTVSCPLTVADTGDLGLEDTCFLVSVVSKAASLIPSKMAQIQINRPNLISTQIYCHVFNITL